MMHGIWFLIALASASAGSPGGDAPKTAAPAKQNVPAALFGQPSLNACAAAMEGIAWNGCDKDADAYVYEDGKSESRVYRLLRGKQRHDVPAGIRYTVIFCQAGWHPIDPKTGAALKKPGARFRCAGTPKP